MATAKKYLAFVILLISITGILFIISLGLFIYFIHSSTLNGVIIVNADTVVPFERDGFNTLFTKDLTVVSNIDHNDHYPLNISFYKSPCNKISKTMDFLNPVSRSVSPAFNLRLPFNYRYGDRPLYAVGDNSKLIYTTIASTDHNISDCPLKLYLFTDEEKYKQFKYPDSPETGYVASSKCLPVGTNSSAIATTTFKLVSDSQNYVAVYVQGGVSVTINITGSILKYSMKSLKREPCFLHNQQNYCVISISESTIATSSIKSCVLFYSPHNNGFVNFTTSSTQIHNIGSVITIIVSGLVFICLLFVLFPISLYYIVMIVYSRRSEYERLSDVERKTLINY